MLREARTPEATTGQLIHRRKLFLRGSGSACKHAGVAQANIGFGDPGRTVDNIFWNKFHSQFPDVKYWGKGNGMTPIESSSRKYFFQATEQETLFTDLLY